MNSKKYDLPLAGILSKECSFIPIADKPDLITECWCNSPDHSVRWFYDDVSYEFPLIAFQAYLRKLDIKRGDISDEMIYDMFEINPCDLFKLHKLIEKCMNKFYYFEVETPEEKVYSYCIPEKEIGEDKTKILEYLKIKEDDIKFCFCSKYEGLNIPSNFNVNNIFPGTKIRILLK